MGGMVKKRKNAISSWRAMERALTQTFED
jgi:hypothetical protein